jgi:ParB family chromosome partitioning protein
MSRADEVHRIPVDLIQPGETQARKRFEPERLAELAASIRESGIVQPLVLRRRGRFYELLAGERRWRAAQLAGLHEVPAVIRDDLDDDAAHILGLIENLQRESLSPIETAEGLRRLGEAFALTHEAIGSRIGKSRAYVTNFLRLLSLAPPVRALVDSAELSLGHAKILAGLDVAAQLKWAAVCVRENLTVRALERRLAAAVPQPARPLRADDWSRLAQQLSEQLGYPVAFQASAKNKGELRIRFHSLDELDGLLERIGCKPN